MPGAGGVPALMPSGPVRSVGSSSSARARCTAATVGLPSASSVLASSRKIVAAILRSDDTRSSALTSVLRDSTSFFSSRCTVPISVNSPTSSSRVPRERTRTIASPSILSASTDRPSPVSARAHRLAFFELWSFSYACCAAISAWSNLPSRIA